MTPQGALRRLSAAGALLVVVGCAQPPKPLYVWENFPRLQYETLLREGASPESQIRAMQAHAEKARGSGGSLPPGFRAHLGMLHLSLGDAATARQMWQSEKAAFPESAPYVDSLLRRLESTVTPAAKENPS